MSILEDANPLSSHHLSALSLIALLSVYHQPVLISHVYLILVAEETPWEGTLK